jgi:transcriptional regulator with XRE-family HTH domain
VQAAGIEIIGKEANLWEAQLHLGAIEGGRVSYGLMAEEVEALRDTVVSACRAHGVRELARASGLSIGTVSAAKRGGGRPSVKTLRRLHAALARM